MKKLLTSIIAATALLFGFVSCSGDLHDLEEPKHEPVTIADASWYYYDITVYGDNTSTGNFILNGSAGQSTDTAMPSFEAKKGGVFYFTANTANKNADKKYELLTSYQEDNPVFTPVPGKVRFYIYTNESACNFYCFGNDDSFESMDGSWPGFAMVKDGEVAVENYDATMQIASITVTGIPAEYQSLTLYSVGDLVGGWSFAESNKSVISGDKLTITYATPLTVTATGPVESIPSKGFKIATSDWKKQISNSIAGGNVDISVLNGKKVDLIGVVNANKSSDGQQIGCDWSIRVLGDIE